MGTPTATYAARMCVWWRITLNAKTAKIMATVTLYVDSIELDAIKTAFRINNVNGIVDMFAASDPQGIDTEPEMLEVDDDEWETPGGLGR